MSRRTELIDANLSRAILVGSNLGNCDLTGAELVDADLSGADLTGARLQRANLENAELVQTDFARADLTGARLAKANVDGADFRGAAAPDLLDSLGAPLGLILRERVA